MYKRQVEAKRIDLAFLFDPMMAVHTSNIDPLPHQITAVYESMLPRQPLRYVLADDPGAGKTIMAGLYIKELLLRDDVKQCLIVAPGGLVEQWQDELFFKFGLRFDLLTNELIDANVNLNVFQSNPLLIARMDQLSRNETLQAPLQATEWDPIAVAEIRHLVHELKGRGIGVLITDHNVRETLEIVDRAYILHDGKVLMSGTTDEVVRDEKVRRVYLGENFRII